MTAKQILNFKNRIFYVILALSLALDRVRDLENPISLRCIRRTVRRPARQRHFPDNWSGRRGYTTGNAKNREVIQVI